MKTAEQILISHMGGRNIPTKKNVVDAMEEYANQFKPKWISVDVDLPPNTDYKISNAVLCKTASGNYFVGCYDYAMDSFRHNDGHGTLRDSVIEWMYLTDLS